MRDGHTNTLSQRDGAGEIAGKGQVRVADGWMRRARRRSAPLGTTRRIESVPFGGVDAVVLLVVS